MRRSDRAPPLLSPLTPRLVVTTRHYGGGGNLQLRASPRRRSRHMLMAPQMGSDRELANHILFIGFTSSFFFLNVLCFFFFFFFSLPHPSPLPRLPHFTTSSPSALKVAVAMGVTAAATAVYFSGLVSSAEH